MSIENDPNIIYGGDPEETTRIDENCASLGEMVISDFKLGEDKPSFINGITNQLWTYRDMLHNTTLMARALYGAGLRQNEVVSIVSENRHEYLAISFGAFFLNAIVAPVNVTYTERELKHALKLSKPKFVFTSPYAAAMTVKVCKTLKFVERVILFGSKKFENQVILFDDFIKKFEKKDFDVEANVARKVNMKDQVAFIACSSGTTGMPKGVLITQTNIMSVIQSYRDKFVLAKMVYGQSPVVLNIAPWFHSLGFLSMALVACSGDVAFVFLPKFEEKAFLKCIQEYKVTTVTVVPPIMVFLAKSPLFEEFDLSSIKDIGCGAASLSKEVEDQVRDRFLKKFNTEVTIKQGYGMSETTLGTLGTNVIIKPGSVGEALQGIYVKVIDENGKTLGVNQRGELCFKGNVIMKGYVNDPEATRATIDKDGWLHSGDIGYYDEDKQFYVVDRLKELIKYNAYQVPPAEIEALLLSNPKIKDCGVIGIPDEEAGELPFAFVVKQPGVELTEQEVVKFVSENTSKPKWLRGGVKFIDTIPKNPSGKLLRREMRDIYKNSKSKL